MTRDSRPDLRFSFENTATSLLALNCIRSLAFPERPFALAYPQDSTTTKNNIVMDDFKRMKVFENKNAFRIFHNTNYQFCETYPKVLVVPSQVSDDDIKEALLFRTSYILSFTHTQHTHTQTQNINKQVRNLDFQPSSFRVLRPTRSYIEAHNLVRVYKIAPSMMSVIFKHLRLLRVIPSLRLRTVGLV